MQKMGGTLQDEKKQAADTEEAMLEVLKEMVNRIKGEVATERRDREIAEDSLLSLLEEACTKLNLRSGAA